MKQRKQRYYGGPRFFEFGMVFGPALELPVVDVAIGGPNTACLFECIGIQNGVLLGSRVTLAESRTLLTASDPELTPIGEG